MKISALAPKNCFWPSVVIQTYPPPLILLLNVAAPAALISNVRAVTSEPPSLPTKFILPSDTVLLIFKLAPEPE